MKALIKDTRGVSVILASIYMLIMLILGSIIVTYCVSNYTVSLNGREEEQDYWDVSSGAVLIRELLYNRVITVTSDGSGNPVYEIDMADGALKPALEAALDPITTTDIEFEMKIDGKLKSTVNGKIFHIDPANGEVNLLFYKKPEGIHLRLSFSLSKYNNQYTLGGGEIKKAP